LTALLSVNVVKGASASVIEVPQIKEFSIVTESHDQINPGISGNVVIWQDNRNGNWDACGARLVRSTNQSRIEGRVFVDTNQNGVLDAGEPGLPGVALTIDSDGWSASTTSRGDGFYDFAALGEGKYKITMHIPSGYHPSTLTTRAGLELSGMPEDVMANINFGLVQRASPGVLDYPIANGHFFTQTGGDLADRGYGFAVTNEEGVHFWDTWQRFGLNVGYPVSQRFLWKGFLTQVFQKAVFQWQPEAGQVYLINTFDELHDAGYDPWLLAFRSTPPQLDPSFDAGKTSEEIVRDRLALLEDNAFIKASYFFAPDPLAVYGLPTSEVTDMGSHWAIRLQRAVIQQWKVGVPWAIVREVTVANGGDIAKELGLFPAVALVPQPPP